MSRSTSQRISIDDLPEFFGPRQAAQTLGMGKDTVYRLVATRDIPSARLGKRIIIQKDCFLKWVASSFSNQG